MAQSLDICGIGNALVDEVYRVPHEVISDLGLSLNQMTLATPAEHAKIKTYLQSHGYDATIACGGSATNTLVAAASFYCTCHQLCRVAEDDEGAAFLSSLSESGITYQMPDHNAETLPTGSCIVLVTPDAKRTMITCLGISAVMTDKFLSSSAISSASYLYMEGYMVTNETNFSTTQAASRLAREAGVKRALSLSDPGIVAGFRSQFLELLTPAIDILFCNEEEAMSLTETHSIDDALPKLSAFTTQYAVTRGAHGAYLFDGQTHYDIPGISVTAIDTNGAGDIFAGACLSRYIQTGSLEDAGHFANKAAAELVQHIGPRLNPDQYAATFGSHIYINKMKR